MTVVRAAILAIVSGAWLAVVACGAQPAATPMATPTPSLASAPAEGLAATPLPTFPPGTQPSGMSLEEGVILHREVNTTDLAITQSDSPDPVVAGESLVYTLTVTNSTTAARGVRLVDVLPSGVSYISGSPGCAEGRPGTVTCDVGFIEIRESAEIVITVRTDAGLVLDENSPATITNEARVENLVPDDSYELMARFGYAERVYPDLDPSNNAASEDTLVVAP